MKAYKCGACGSGRDPCYLINACGGKYSDPYTESCPYNSRPFGGANWQKIDVAEIMIAIKDVKP